MQIESNDFLFIFSIIIKNRTYWLKNETKKKKKFVIFFDLIEESHSQMIYKYAFVKYINTCKNEAVLLKNSCCKY